MEGLVNPAFGQNCRFCGAELSVSFVDLGMSPLSNSNVPVDKRHQPEVFYPLHAYVCSNCYLVQVAELESRENIFSDYRYFSSFSDLWLKHCETYANEMTVRFGLGGAHQVIEVASNDGYLLQYFKARGIPVFGIEPAENVARVAESKGIPSDVAFFGAETAQRLRLKGFAADLIVANNVLAHVPDINDFVAGFKILLKSAGLVTFEFPSLHRLIVENQFDTIYHEHFSYLSLLVVERVLERHGMRAFDVESLSTHGGSLRVFACAQQGPHRAAPGLEAQRLLEHNFGLDKMVTYRAFSRKIVDLKAQVLEFFLSARHEGKRVAGYGAPAKGNTLLNYCGIGPEFLPFTVDRSPYKQGTLLPGSRIPVMHPDEVMAVRPDYLFILPWNLRSEIVEQMKGIREWGGKFVVPIPAIEIF